METNTISHNLWLQNKTNYECRRFARLIERMIRDSYPNLMFEIIVEADNNFDSFNKIFQPIIKMTTFNVSSEKVYNPENFDPSHKIFNREGEEPSGSYISQFSLGELIYNYFGRALHYFEVHLGFQNGIVWKYRDQYTESIVREKIDLYSSFGINEKYFNYVGG